jgi:hypothetical protein
VAVALAHLRPSAAHASGARARHGFGGELTPESSTPAVCFNAALLIPGTQPTSWHGPRSPKNRIPTAFRHQTASCHGKISSSGGSNRMISVTTGSGEG